VQQKVLPSYSDFLHGSTLTVLPPPPCLRGSDPHLPSPNSVTGMEASKPHLQRMRMHMRRTHPPAAGMHEPQHPWRSKQWWEEQRCNKWPISGQVSYLPQQLLLHRQEGGFQGSLAIRALCWLHICFPMVPSPCQTPQSLALCSACLCSQADTRLQNNGEEMYSMSKHFNVSPQ